MSAVLDKLSLPKSRHLSFLEEKKSVSVVSGDHRDSAAACWGTSCSRDKTELQRPIDAQEEQLKPTGAVRKSPFAVSTAARDGGGKGQEVAKGQGQNTCAGLLNHYCPGSSPSVPCCAALAVF